MPSLVARDRHRYEVRRAGGDERAEVGRRLDDHRAAGRREPAQARGERGLAAADDDHVVGRVAAAEPAGVLRAQRRDALPRASRPTRRAAARRGPAPGPARRAAAAPPAGSRSRARASRAAAAAAAARARPRRASARRARPSATRGRAPRRGGRRARRTCPAPGPRLDEPRRASRWTARWTVAGPAPWRRISSRTDGSRSPGRPAAAAASSSSTSARAVLPSGMTESR